MKSWLKMVLMVVLASVALSACKKEEAQVPQAAALPPLVVPGSVDDEAGWKTYVGERLKRAAKEQGLKGRPFVYYLPNGKDRTELTGQLTDHVLRGIMSGTTLAFGGPNSAETSAMIAEAFGQAAEMSLKGVKVVFIGDAAHQQTIADAIAKSGAELIFLEAK